MTIRSVLETHPKRDTFDLNELFRCIDSLGACIAACNICADACLYEEGDLRRCIQIDLDCADVCRATMSVLSRPGPAGDAWRQLLETCAKMCAVCAEECGSHEHAHCVECAKVCREAEKACQQLLAAAS